MYIACDYDWHSKHGKYVYIEMLAASAPLE